MSSHFAGDAFELVGPCRRGKDLEMVGLAGCELHLQVRPSAGMAAEGEGDFTTVVVDGQCAQVGEQFSHQFGGDFVFKFREEGHRDGVALRGFGFKSIWEEWELWEE